MDEVATHEAVLAGGEYALDVAENDVGDEAEEGYVDYEEAVDDYVGG